MGRGNGFWAGCWDFFKRTREESPVRLVIYFFTLNYIHQKEFYNDIDADYFVIENHLNFLIGDGALQEDKLEGLISLSRKGWFMMTNSGTDGYEAKKKKESKKKAWTIILGIVSIATFILVTIRFTKDFVIPPKSKSPIETIKSDPVRQFAEFVLQGGVPRGIEEGLLETQIFDSINSPIDSTRDYYFKVSLCLIEQGTASLNPGMAKNVHTLINKNPEYIFSFLKNYDENLVVDVGVCLGNYYQFYKMNQLAEQTHKTLQSYTTNNDVKEIVSGIIKGIGYGMQK